MAWSKTRWGMVKLVAWFFVIGYVFAVLITQLHWHAGWGWPWPDWLRDICNTGLAVALMIISISFGGLLEDYYTQLTGFGISKVRKDRQGQDPTLTQLWIDRISDSKVITIVGTLSQGWFVVAHKNLEAVS